MGSFLVENKLEATTQVIFRKFQARVVAKLVNNIWERAAVNYVHKYMLWNKILKVKDGQNKIRKELDKVYTYQESISAAQIWLQQAIWYSTRWFVSASISLTPY